MRTKKRKNRMQLCLSVCVRDSVEGSLLLLKRRHLSTLVVHLLSVLLGVVTLAQRTAVRGDEAQVLAALGGRRAHLGDGILGLLGTASLDPRGDQTLDLRGLQPVLLAALHNATANYVLAYVFGAGQVEQLANLASALRTETAGSRGVCHTLDRLVTNLGDGHVHQRNVAREHAATNVLAAALTLIAAKGVEANRAALHQQRHTAGGEHAGDHRETILVGATAQAEDVALELAAKDRTVHLVTETVILQLHAAEHLVRDLELLHRPVAGVRDVELHWNLWICVGRIMYK
ncbi:40S ribosomal protein S6, putative [Leishmania tarentolae]|uniref:40S ribosomal protein S6, putative n=1 Tax=Leishmania tarentolae TaxID=5689 RepID=A0A640KFG8_LEITA|nr:40S ribosomal protein S6, putative [Leishmania tarentolae]